MIEKLTSLQRGIIRAAREGSMVTFTSKSSRRLGTGWYHHKGGILIRAYGHPEYFLVKRGLLERVPRPDRPTVWYRLTAKGKQISRDL